MKTLQTSELNYNILKIQLRTTLLAAAKKKTHSTPKCGEGVEGGSDYLRSMFS